jgi:hypothetical protein
MDHPFPTRPKRLEINVKRLALPREARDFNEINELRKGLGNARLIELQGNSAGRPKPFPRAHERTPTSIGPEIACGAPETFGPKNDGHRLTEHLRCR